MVATLIGVDDERFYLGGEDISAFDLATRKILWSVKVNLGTSWSRPLLTQGRIYHFSPRGIFEIDKADGRVVHLFRGADLDSLGGELLVTPKALLAISNLAITAYPLGASATLRHDHHRRRRRKRRGQLVVRTTKHAKHTKKRKCLPSTRLIAREGNVLSHGWTQIHTDLR